MSVVRPTRPRVLLVLLLALVAGLGVLTPASPAVATSYGGAVSGTWPTTWTTYTYANGTVIGDTNSDQTPPYMDLVSGTCSGCVGTQPSVLFANDGTSAFFRMRMAVDNNDASKGGLFGGAFLVQIADATNTVRAVVGVDGKQSGADNVYVTNAVGGTTQIVYEYPFTGTSAGMRWTAVGDGTGQYFLDFQVPVSVVSTISGGAITPTTPVKLYYGSSAAANLATINKDLMIPGANSVDFTTLAVTKLIPPTYAVTFDSDGGSAASGQTVTEGDRVVEPTAPARSGYVFDGWYDGSTAWSFSTAVTGALTLTAHWARPSHAVTFDSDGGSAVATQNVEEGSAATAPTAPTRTGWTFAGWYDGASAYDFSSLVSGPVALTAHWTRTTYAVTFDSDGGSAVSGQTVNHGDAAVQPTTPTRSGHTFTGWYDGASAWSFASPVTGALTLTAHWARVTHAVTFDSDGGSAVATQHVDEGSAATAPTAPTRTGWTFTGWYDGTTAWDFTDPITDAVTLTAHWTHDTYAVTFDTDGGTTVTGQTIAQGDPATEPTAPTRTGWTFTGWFHGTTAWDFTDPITTATTLTAHWARITHTVTFDSDGGSTVAPQDVEEDAAATEPTAPTRTGWTFTGWFHGTTAWDFTDPITDAVTLTAHWTHDTYAVTFDTDGGTTVTGQTIAHGAPATEPTAPTRTGYTFDGWYADGSPYDFATAVTGALTLTAHWTAVTYTITFVTNGGTSVPPLVVGANGVAVRPVDPVRAGYVFLGWYDGSQEWDFDDPITATTALSALWASAQNDVTFDSAGGSAVATQGVAYGVPAITPGTPTRTGYTFAGWYDGATAYDFTAPVTGPVALTAHWTALPVPPVPPTPPTTDLDSDHDGLSDAAELARGTDPDRADSDRDGISDGDEVAGRTGRFGCTTDPLDADTDGDGLRDGRELRGDRAPRTDPCRADTDHDGLDDRAEVTGAANGFDRCGTDPRRADTDGDTLPDGSEVRGQRLRGRILLRGDRVLPIGRVRTDPCHADTDRDGLSDGRELGGTRVRSAHATYRSNPLRPDTDRDGLTDRQEVSGVSSGRYHHRVTDPMNWDTDGGGVSDGFEVNVGSDPTDLASGPAHPRATDGV